MNLLHLPLIYIVYMNIGSLGSMKLSSDEDKLSVLSARSRPLQFLVFGYN